ncbi:TetR/AcrR family transcriptional regulator [Roseomonas marmotae]|uniref:TetR/AcrR family transcriptional regulator n=1 Tax=Roseomonas marmotae TaxID=2768161 RepID=A0ABS3KBZ3_9PROT|nr:TetR/AcrR family transcriptional regulator [Roseomonas marmotae]MBO1074986.1 TetR/AcrR family transcriptional regulator [Roseomonas marmotae]QTI79976.1 TetR/AcrR family transcriptional regulator [Roseomonas marmotae]
MRVATELFTLRGFRGVSFADIAVVLGITTTNIHYHFGNKMGLANAVLEHYSESVGSRFRSIWADPQTSLAQKVQDTLEFNRQLYQNYNPAGDEGNAWSLLTRFASDVDALDDAMRQRLSTFRRSINTQVFDALGMATASGELVPDAPRAEVARILASAFTYASLIARDAGGFAGLERYYETVLDLIFRAYGLQAAPRLVAELPARPEAQP